MHLHFERCPGARCDCPLLSLTWMGKVPDEIPDEEGWKLNRTNYYQEGWLATGNVRGVVGVTFSTCHCKKIFEEPLRTNYNLRGHRSEVSLVKWNEPYQKLASCDSSGIIFVWIKYEGRWSIELINDRNTQVTDFSWSHDGRMALICYQDGFVLVGSVAGQRYWSSMLNLDGTITCGIWTPDDQQVLFGTTTGQIVVMDVHGGMVAQVSILDDVEICAMAWSCEKFKMEEGDDDDASDTSRSSRVLDRPSVLAISFKNGLVYIMKNYDDVSPIVIMTSLKGLKMEWTNAGDILAIAGNISTNGDVCEYTNIIQFYMETGVLRYTTCIPRCQHPVTALTWGHNDKRLFVATGPFIHVGWVTRKVASLQLLSRLAVYDHLQSEVQTSQLLLPKRLKTLVSSLFCETIKSCFPEPQNMREFVCRPPSGSVRYHCTMIRHDDDLNLSSGTCYTLYLEYLGGLVPLLKGKRSSKIRPEFIIYDPQGSEERNEEKLESVLETRRIATLLVSRRTSSVSKIENSPNGSDSSGDSGIVKTGPSLINGHHYNGLSDLSDSEYDDGCASPRLQRRRRALKRLIREQLELELRLVENLAYIDMLPENAPLVEVTSNIWGTKFKMHGVASFLPSNLGQVTYKTSLLHLQPRQMTLLVAELRDDLPYESDPTFNPNMFSEDEDECHVMIDDEIHLSQSQYHKEALIAPMTPKKRVTNGIGPHHTILHPVSSSVRTSNTGERSVVTSSRDSSGSAAAASTSSLLRSNTDGCGDNEADEFPYVDFTTCPELLNIIERESRSYARDVANKIDCTEAQSTNNCVVRADSSVAPSASVTLVSSPSRISLTSGSVAAIPCRPRADSRSVRLTASPSPSSPPTSSQCRLRHAPDAASLRRSPTATNNKQCSSVTPTSPVAITLNQLPPSQPLPRTLPRWAEKACDLKYIDEDEDGTVERTVRSNLPQARLLSRCRSHSVGHLNSADVMSASAVSNVVRVGSLREMKRRLILSQERRSVRHSPPSLHCRRHKLMQCGKSRSLDSGSVFTDSHTVTASSNASKGAGGDGHSLTIPPPRPSVNVGERHQHICYRPPLDVIVHVPSPPSPRRNNTPDISPISKSHLSSTCSSSSSSTTSSSSSSSSSSVVHTRPSSPLLQDCSAVGPRTPPSTPTRSFSNNNQHRPKSSLRRKSLLNSPLLSRRSWRGKVVESSDDEITYSGDEMSNSNNYKDLESFQKAHIRQKLRKERQRHENNINSSPNRPQRKEFLMHNKAPLWNENSQVYQLDFGGRVTQESAKNFQIEFRGKQVMQFGRIDGNAYTLDFQYPFTAVQAFAVALANVTQRLK